MAKVDKKVLYIGEARGNSLSRYNYLNETFSSTRIVTFHDLYASLFWRVVRRLSGEVFSLLCGNRVKSELNSFRPDIVWVEMGREIPSKIIKGLDAEGIVMINTYSDNFMDAISKKVSIEYNNSIPYYDCIFTPRESDYSLYKSYGVRRIEKFWKGFDSSVISTKNLKHCDRIVFAGHNEKDREEYFDKIALKYNVLVDVYGNGWNHQKRYRTSKSLDFSNYGSIYENSIIGINFFSKWAKDTQNSRLFEIPASNTFMLSERSDDALNCFKEGYEADFFSSYEEFESKMLYYLKHDRKREKIRERGFKKARSLYSNRSRMENIVKTVLELYLEKHGRL